MYVSIYMCVLIENESSLHLIVIKTVRSDVLEILKRFASKFQE